MMRFAKFCALCLALAGLGGCGLFFDDPYVTVTANPLNWVEIHYYNATREPIRRVNLRVNGMGRVKVASGTSKRVSDSFAKDMSDVAWDDYDCTEYDVDAEHVRALFQDLVNAGLFDREKIGQGTKYPSHGRLVAVRAAMENKTYSEPKNVFETDPELAERLYNMVLEFNHPVLARRRTKTDGTKAHPLSR